MKKYLAGICMLALAVTACNLNSKEVTRSPQSKSAIDTVVAQTMQAFQSTPLATPTEMLLPPTSISPSPTALPKLVVNAATPCRSGPAETFISVVDLNPNQSETVIGKDPSGKYWLVQISSGTCWVAAQSVTVTGNTQNVPELTPPPATAGGVPAQPGSLFYSYSCASSTQATITLTCRDVADNETGYRVFRNGSQIVDLPANTTTYTDDTSRGSGSTFTYNVEAYNDVGSSSRRTTGSIRLDNCANP